MMWEVMLISLGYTIASNSFIETPGIRYGSNAEKRIGGENIIVAVP